MSRISRRTPFPRPVYVPTKGDIAWQAIKVVFWVIVYAVILVGCYFLSAWLLMIAAGVVHAQWLTVMPTMGYKAALAMAWIPGIVFGGAAASSQNGKK